MLSLFVSIHGRKSGTEFAVSCTCQLHTTHAHMRAQTCTHAHMCTSRTCSCSTHARPCACTAFAGTWFPSSSVYINSFKPFCSFTGTATRGLQCSLRSLGRRYCVFDQSFEWLFERLFCRLSYRLFKRLLGPLFA